MVDTIFAMLLHKYTLSMNLELLLPDKTTDPTAESYGIFLYNKNRFCNNPPELLFDYWPIHEPPIWAELCGTRNNVAMMVLMSV